ncbi:MgtC/SapB family protein [Clostridium fermenticellae]|uniref:MgtC/SapB family protein n=1 Tax=Clostridium fermenticellae TaxID=2068654 RepID=A0A386H463_9CLOT|nr:MgtC/SapB family protein [Clostridium fermenticellae]AYD40470.1 MgtC/SapB family protein [Clostridium fermenticellae]
MSVKETIIRLILAILIGGIIGYEREHKNRPAGFITHILVCLGACVISMIQVCDVDKTVSIILEHPQLSSALKVDIGRLGAQVISGIGFLGAGTIIREKGSVTGLTTAASLWVVACIGLAVGLGYYNLSILSAVAAVISLVVLKRVELIFSEKRDLLNIDVKYKDKGEIINKINSCLKNQNFEIRDINFLSKADYDVESEYKKGTFSIFLSRHEKDKKVINELMSIEEVVRITIK